MKQLLIVLSLSFTSHASGLSNVESRIIGGAKISQARAAQLGVVGIFNTESMTICSGTLIPNERILTAAHCVASAPIGIHVIFRTDLNEFIANPDASRGDVRSTRFVAVHPGWNHGSKEDENDIALIGLDRPAPVDYIVQSFTQQQRQISAGTTALIAGFGANEIAHDPATGKIRHLGPGILRESTVKISDVGENEVLVDQSAGSGACVGDSGGPGYLIESGKILLWGVVSRGSNNECNAVGKYTNVVPYLDWINGQSE